MSYDTEPDFDYVFVEAHTVGQDDWTTLPDANGHTSRTPASGCPDDDPFWLTMHPFLSHYITRTGDAGAFDVHADRHDRRRGTRRPATRAASRTGTST